jgi:hypothetical protein
VKGRTKEEVVVREGGQGGNGRREEGKNRDG